MEWLIVSGVKPRSATVFRIASGNSVRSDSGCGFGMSVMVQAAIVGVSVEFFAGAGWYGRPTDISRASAPARPQQPQRRHVGGREVDVATPWFIVWENREGTSVTQLRRPNQQRQCLHEDPLSSLSGNPGTHHYLAFLTTVPQRLLTAAAIKLFAKRARNRRRAKIRRLFSTGPQ